jgi:voltage-gated potassium channel Kch
MDKPGEQPGEPEMPHRLPKAAASHSPPRGLWPQVQFWLFDVSQPHGIARRVELSVGWLIIFSVVAIVAEQNDALYAPYQRWFDYFDVLCIAVFTAEFVLRLACAPHDPEFSARRMPRLAYLVSRYAIIDLLAIAPFYLGGLIALDLEAMMALRALRLARVFKLSRYVMPAWHEFLELNLRRSFRGKVYALLEPTGHSGKLHTYVDNFIVFWVLLSIVSVVLGSVDAIEAALTREFFIIDTLAFLMFAVEYVARLYCAPENPKYQHRRFARLAYARSGHAIIDLLVIVPFLIQYVLPLGLDLRFLRVFRLLRLLKLTRYTRAAHTLYSVVRREAQVLLAAAFVMLLLVVLTASIGYIFEHDAQPDKFENIPQAIYWAVVTLASVGYGDISPVTPMGRALTVVLALVGIGIFAIPAGLLASAFTDQLRIEREAFKARLLHAYQHGSKLDAHARAELEAETERLHLSPDDVKRLTQEARQALDDRKRAQQQAGPMLIDPKDDAELACRQARLLVAQLQLLVQATGSERLTAHIVTTDDEAQAFRRVLAAIAEQPGNQG